MAMWVRQPSGRPDFEGWVEAGLYRSPDGFRAADKQDLYDNCQ
jgi:hypothetical protein